VWPRPERHGSLQDHVGGRPRRATRVLASCRRCGNQSMIVLSWPDLPKDPLTFDRSGVAHFPPQSWDGEGGG
jgi:hypothetical protein